MLAHPLLALVLGALLLIDIWHWGTYSSRHLPILAAPCCILTAGRTFHPRIPMMLILGSTEGLRLLDVYSDEGDAIASASPRPPEVRGEAMALPAGRSWGLLAPVFTTEDHTLHILDEGRPAPFTAQERAQIRAEFAKSLRSWNGGALAGSPYPAALAQGDGKLILFSWRALIHDVLALLALCIVAAGARRYRRERREQLRLRAIERVHRCPECHYDITGLTDRCPECGHSLRS